MKNHLLRNQLLLFPFETTTWTGFVQHSKRINEVCVTCKSLLQISIAGSCELCCVTLLGANNVAYMTKIDSKPINEVCVTYKSLPQVSIAGSRELCCLTLLGSRDRDLVCDLYFQFNRIKPLELMLAFVILYVIYTSSSTGSSR